jgi:hypothetical protein
VPRPRKREFKPGRTVYVVVRNEAGFTDVVRAVVRATDKPPRGGDDHRCVWVTRIRYLNGNYAATWRIGNTFNIRCVFSSRRAALAHAINLCRLNAGAYRLQREELSRLLRPNRKPQEPRRAQA